MARGVKASPAFPRSLGLFTPPQDSWLGPGRDAEGSAPRAASIAQLSASSAARSPPPTWGEAGPRAGRACLGRAVGVDSRGRSGRRGRGAGGGAAAVLVWPQQECGELRVGSAPLEQTLVLSRTPGAGDFRGTRGSGRRPAGPLSGTARPGRRCAPCWSKVRFLALPLSASFFFLTGLSGRRAPGGQVASPRVGARPHRGGRPGAPGQPRPRGKRRAREPGSAFLRPDLRDSGSRGACL